MEKTLNRHGNQKLSDEITRVGSSPIRKLGPNDRLIAPIVKQIHIIYLTMQE